MDAFEVLHTRRSIRQFLNRPVGEDLVKELLSAAMSAPTAGGIQPWRFVVITDREKLDKIPNFHPYAGMIKQAPLAILIALLLNQKFKGRGLIRTLIFVPYVVSEVIVGTGWSLLLQKKGAINEILANFGINGPDWLADPKIAIWTLLLLISWKYVGFAVILMLAGMQSIPEELYEAAKVDGASFWQMQKSITLPLLAPTLRIWVFLSMIGSLQLFDLVYIVWGKYVSTTAGVSTMATYMVREGRGAGNYGYGSAVALIIFVISLIIALVYQKFVLNRDLDGAVTEQKEAKKRARKRAKEAQHREVAALASEVK